MKRKEDVGKGTVKWGVVSSDVFLKIDTLTELKTSGLGELKNKGPFGIETVNVLY